MKKAMNLFLGVMGAAVSGFLLTEGIFLARIVSDAKKDYEGELDYLMILGGLILDEDTPSSHLLKRITKAADYLNSHTGVIAVCCGGCFREKQKKSEAQVIKEYLIRLGVDGERILTEDKSTTTNENFIFAKEIIKKHSKKEFYELKTGFLSSDYHLFRAGIIAKINGLPGLKKIGAKSGRDFIRGTARELMVAPDMISNYLSAKKDNFS